MTQSHDRILNELIALQDRAPEDRCKEALRILLISQARDEFNPRAIAELDKAFRKYLSADYDKYWDQAPDKKNVYWENSIDQSQMVRIKRGPFCVGDARIPAESDEFFLARHPVTNAQFATFLEQTQYHPTDEESFLQHWDSKQCPPERKDHPVVWISYIDALHYCKWANLMLPTEWLWEKAARGEDGRLYPWGNQCPYASTWDYTSHAYSKAITLTQVVTNDTCAAGTFPQTRTAYGCEDMVGNVSEWCVKREEGDWGEFPPTPGNVLGFAGLQDQLAAVRGSCFMRQAAIRMVASHRRQLSTGRRNRWVGFRPGYFPQRIQATIKI